MRHRLQPVVIVPWWLIGVAALLALPLFLAAIVSCLIFWALLLLLAGLDWLVQKLRREDHEQWLTRHGVRREWPDDAV